MRRINYEGIIYLVGFLDLFGVSMVVTCIPSHLSKLGVSGLNVGFFMSLYGAIQLFSSSFMGYLADLHGKRFMLKLCAIFSSISYFFLGFSPSFKWLIVSRIFTGIFKHTLTLSSAVLSSETTFRNRDRILGYFSAASSFAFLLGPPLGGWLYDNFGFHVVSSFCGSTFILIWISLHYASFNNQEVGSCKRSSHHPCSEKGIRQIIALWDLYALQFLMGTSVMIFRTNFSTAMKARFDAPVFITGLIISSGSLSGVIGGMVAGNLMKIYRLQHIRLVFDACLIRTLSMLGCALAPNLTIFVIMQLPLSFSNAASKEALTSLLMARVSDRASVGRVLGFGQSLLSFSRLVTPFIGSLILDWNMFAPSLVGTACASVTCLISLKSWKAPCMPLHED